mgnify:CR=1 FL=1
MTWSSVQDNPDLRRGGVHPRPQHPMAPFGRAGVKPAPTRKGCSLDLLTVFSMRRNLGRSEQAVPVESCLLLPNETFGVGCLPVLGQQWGAVYPRPSCPCPPRSYFWAGINPSPTKKNGWPEIAEAQRRCDLNAQHGPLSERHWGLTPPVLWQPDLGPDTCGRQHGCSDHTVAPRAGINPAPLLSKNGKASNAERLIREQEAGFDGYSLL